MAAPLIFLATLVLYAIVPGRRVTGYARDASGQRLRYRLNGLLVFALVVGGFCAAAGRGLVAWDYFFTHRWEIAAGACVSGLVFTALMMRAGRPENPQWRDVDAKMYLYLAGAIGLELNAISFAAHQWLAFPEARSPGVALHAVLLTFFAVEYLTFEEVHLYTWDFVAERVGFKLGWGCLCFYPTFYAVGLWFTADRPDPHVPTWLLALGVALFFAGWILSRGANLQKFYFKLRGESGLLATGFWGVSRHVNYLGEILMASGLALVLWPAWGPWLYPLYYVGLLVPRQRADDARCAAKYGGRWQEYCARVRWRILPWVY